jgi:hypothetical protein
MGAQFDKVTVSPELSLTLIVDDLARQIQTAPSYLTEGPMDLGGWLNALHRQSTQLIQSESARSQLEAWLDEVDLHFPTETSAA